MTREQFFALLIMGFSVVKEFVNQYLFCDWEFFAFLTILMMLDLILGIWKHIILETVSSKGFGQCIKKFIIYGIALILSHIMSNYTVGGSRNILFVWIPNLIYSALVVKEAISIVENIGVIYPESIPSWLLKKLKEYDKKGKFKK